jgi:hypothetical protein
MHTIDIDRVELKTEVQVKQVQKVYSGRQATTCVDTILALDQGKPWCITPSSMIFILINIFMLRMIVH